MEKVKIQLSETHRLAILHQPNLEPDALVGELERFGKISSYSAYILTDANILTLISFSEPQSSEECYNNLKENVSERHHSDILKTILHVGWAHDGGERDFLKKPYVKGKYPQSRGNNEKEEEESESGYLVIFVERLTAYEQEEVAQIVKAFAIEQFSDLREGGRLFARFSNEPFAEDCRQAILARYEKLGRAVSYADELEFELAKKKKSNGLIG